MIVPVINTVQYPQANRNFIYLFLGCNALTACFPRLVSPIPEGSAARRLVRLLNLPASDATSGVILSIYRLVSPGQPIACRESTRPSRLYLYDYGNCGWGSSRMRASRSITGNSNNQYQKL